MNSERNYSRGKTGAVPTVRTPRRGLWATGRRLTTRHVPGSRSAPKLSAWRRRFGSRRTMGLGERVRLDIVQRAALAQTVTAFVLLVAAALAFRHGTSLPWFGLAAILAFIALSSGIVYWSIRRFERLRSGSLLLIGGDGLALVLLWLLLGPQSSLALLAPIVFCIGVLLLDTAAVIGLATGLILTYLLLSVLAARATLHPPLTLAPAMAQIVTAALTAGGLAITVIALVAIKQSFERATLHSAQEAADLDELRLRASQRSRQFIADLAQLQHVQEEALAGNYRLRLHCSDSDLRPIAHSTNQLLERLERLSHDEQRAEAIEAAVRDLAQMVELARSGRPWTWPRPSNTVVDHLVDVLRRPAARRSL
jgi:hypothetical protein